jgi:hypothetical protein
MHIDDIKAKRYVGELQAEMSERDLDVDGKAILNFLMLFQLLRVYTVCMWAVLPTFRMHMLLPPSDPKGAGSGIRTHCDGH